MLNIEDLTLFLSVLRTDSTYVEGTHLYDDILAFMPQLYKFVFSINTAVENCNPAIELLSHDDIRYSLIEKGNRHIGSHINNRVLGMRGQCHVYSLPYRSKTNLLTTDAFEGDVFDKVRSMIMDYIRPFKHELFEKVSQHFPFLRKLTVVNPIRQKNKQHSSAFVTFPHLEQLDITLADVDYAEQFLFQNKTRLPRLFVLHVSYETLAIVTNNFTNNSARLNCSQIRRLLTNDCYVQSKDFHRYFPLL